MSDYSFCETTHAGPLSPWHIRELTMAGKKFGGGADTLALCGRKVAWDLEVIITPRHIADSTCSLCRASYLESQAVRP
jgi:hypothetical protein